MGYFEGMTQAAFNKDVQGRDLYFPNGKLGRGYVMETEGEYKEFAAFHKKRLVVMIVLPLLLVALRISYTIIIPVFVVLALGDYLITRNKTKNLVRTDIKFSIKEASERSTKAFGLPVLIGLMVISVLMVLFFGLGLIGIAASPDPETPVILACGVMLALGLLMSWIFGRRIILLRRAQKA